MKNQFALLFLVVLFCSCGNNEKPKEVFSYDTIVNKKQVPTADSSLTAQDSIKATGRQVLTFLKEENYAELVKYFSPDQVLFSPYGFIDQAKCKKLNAADFLESIQRNWILTWGNADGTGEPIKLRVKEYLKKFVYNADYLNAEAVGFDEVLKSGNTLNNLKDIYPNHHFIDYHFSGFDQKLNGMDWSTLRLVFEKRDGQYFVVAIIHDQWTV